MTKHMFPNRMGRRGMVFVAVLVSFLASADIVFGQTLWTGGTDDWLTGSNWTLGVPDANSPTAFDAVIENGGTAQLLAPGGSVRRLRVGRVAGPGNLLVDAGILTVTENLHLNEGSAGPASMTVRNGSTVTSPSVVVGHTSAFNSTLRITTDAFLFATDLNVGQAGSGTGTLMVDQGGDLSDTDGFIARFAGSTGNATVSGAGSAWISSGILRVGHIGNGTLTVTDGGTVSSDFGYVSVDAGSTSTVTVSGTGSNWTNSSELSIGYEGTGTLTIEDGGAVFNGGGLIGSQSNSNGTATVSGDGSQWTNSSGLYVGDEGEGSLTITGGGDVSDNYAYIANAAGSQGTAIVDGVGSTWTNDGHLYVGNAGSGSLTITHGGQVTSTSFGTVYIGAKADSSGVVTIEGAGSSLTTNDAMILGGEAGTPSSPGGNAYVTIRSGAQVVSNSGYIAYTPGSESEVRVEGPGSTWTTNQLLAVGNNGVGNLHITAGGKVYTSNGDAYIGGTFGTTGSGSVVVDGADSAWDLLSSDPSGLYVGDDGPGSLAVTNGGTVFVASFNGIQIGAQGIVTGNGTLDAWVYNGGIVAPGSSVGTLTIINSPYRQYATGSLQIELASAASYDKLNIPGGGAFLEGGTLDVKLLGGYSPASGTSFDLMDWNPFGSITGTFATLNLPDLPGMLDWDTSQLYSAGVLRVIGSSVLPGDYNDNGIVDADDYIVWRDKLGQSVTLPNDTTPGTVAAVDYNVWRAHFGQIAGSGAIVAAIPEPASGVLGLMAVVLLMWVRPAFPRTATRRDAWAKEAAKV